MKRGHIDPAPIIFQIFFEYALCTKSNVELLIFRKLFVAKVAKHQKFTIKGYSVLTTKS